jgi:RimJ/RimL family protein N-acetyltransferase
MCAYNSPVEELVTPRLRLRPVQEGDLAFLLDLWNDPLVMRYAGFPQGKGWGEADIKGWFERLEAGQSSQAPEETHWLILLADGTPIGESGGGKLPSGWAAPGYTAPAGRIAGMTDVKLAPAFWGQGYATEALQALLYFYFTATGTEELLVPPHVQNPAALRLYEKCGFVDIGLSPWPGHRLFARTRGHYLAGLPG